MHVSEGASGSGFPAWTAAIAFALATGCFFLVFFSVRVGDRDPLVILGKDLVLGMESMPLDPAHSDTSTAHFPEPDKATGSVPEPNSNVADKARKFLRAKKTVGTTTDPASSGAVAPSREPFRSTAAIVLLASTLLVLVASVIPKRGARFPAVGLWLGCLVGVPLLFIVST